MTTFHMQSNPAAFLSRQRQAISQALNEVNTNAAFQAIVKAPRDTGFLAGTIEAWPSTPATLSASFGNKTAAYALWVEIGTSRMRAQPYLSPAAFEEYPKFPAILRGLMGSGLGGKFSMPTLSSSIGGIR
jgi:hypothetical protein